MMKFLFFSIAISSCFFAFSQAGSTCALANTLAFNTNVCNTNSFPGSFPDNGSAPANGCNGNYNDGEYWYKITGTGTQASVIVSSLSATHSGVFIYSGCPSSGGTCLASQVNGNSTFSYNATTPILTLGQTYYIVVANFASVPSSQPYQTNFCITVVETSPPVVASNCANFANVCTNYGFQIQPNGYGTVREIPNATVGSISNPLYGLSNPPNPWGTPNQGCLRSGEMNSTWMVINISVSGSLQFTFGGVGTQMGYYDWAMYPYNGASSCSAISGNTLAPVRCNWNAQNYGGTGLALSTALPTGGVSGNFEPPLNVVAGQKYIICFSNWSNSTTSVPLVFGGTATVSCINPLGVDLVSFDVNGSCDESTALIEWKTIDEVNHDYFDVLKSFDGVQWNSLGRITSKSFVEDGTNVYQLRDLKFEEAAYFKLKQVGLDGKESFSDIKRVNCSESIKLNSLFPNPANDQTVLTFMTKEEGLLSIYDQTGRLINEIKLENTKGKITKKSIDVSSFESGAYIFVIATNGNRASVKFLK